MMDYEAIALVERWVEEARLARVRGPKGRAWSDGVIHCVEELRKILMEGSR